MTRARPPQPADPLAITQPWAALARCAQIDDPEIFFPEPDASPAPALAVCATCPVRRPCLAFALDHRLSCGVWGGTTARERAALLAAGATAGAERSAA
jgi:hypothetical protein